MVPCGCGLLWSRFGFTLKNFTPGKLQTQQKFIKFRSQKKARNEQRKMETHTEGGDRERGSANPLPKRFLSFYFIALPAHLNLPQHTLPTQTHSHMHTRALCIFDFKVIYGNGQGRVCISMNFNIFMPGWLSKPVFVSASTRWPCVVCAHTL